MRIVAAVYDILSPLFTQIKEDLAAEVREGLAALRENITSIQQQIDSLTETVNNHKQSTDEHTTRLWYLLMAVNTNMSEGLSAVNTSMSEGLSAVNTSMSEGLSAVNTSMSEGLSAVNTGMSEGLSAVNTGMSEGLSAVNTSMSEGLSEVKTELQEHSNKTASELAGLETNQETLDSKLDSLDTKQDTLSSTVTIATNRLEHTVLTNVTEELKKTADYIVEQLPPYECGGSGGWRRVVYLNMTDPNTNCPSGWQLCTRYSNICGKVNFNRLSCDSVFFPVSGGDYTSVCGSIRAYQYGHTDAFEAYHDGDVTTIEGAYVSGVSLTHGSPRQHIWTFAAGSYETDFNDQDACPCDATVNITIPPFVGGDYFCESGVNSGTASIRFYPEDPLWDGQGCSSSSTCCSFTNPPYFTKQLPSPTSDPIEARLCRLDWDDDSPVEFMELYVK